MIRLIYSLSAMNLNLNVIAVSQPGSSPLFNIPSATPARKTDDFLNGEGEKNDYDWYIVTLFVSMYLIFRLLMNDPRHVVKEER